jgi:WD40 repeat protein
VPTGRELRRLGAGRVEALAFAPDGMMVAVGGDGAGGLYDPTTGDRRAWFGTGQWEVRYLAFSPDGRMLFSGGDDGTVCGWAVR